MDKGKAKRSYVTTVGVGYGQTKEIAWTKRKHAEAYLKQQRLEGRFGSMRAEVSNAL